MFEEDDIKPEETAKTFVPDYREMAEKTQEQFDEFSSLLASLDKTLDKKKKLWQHIYENAVTDRRNAYMVFTDLYENVCGRSEQHAIHGQTIAKYLERMSKATDQLVKLAELVAKAEEAVAEVQEDTALDADDIYSTIKAVKKLGN